MMQKPLTEKILSDPNHEFVKKLIYIYSMQSFIFSEMNKASRNKDKTKIEFYGPLASAIGYIIHKGNKDQTELAHTTKFVTYRGLYIDKEAFQRNRKSAGINMKL